MSAGASTRKRTSSVLRTGPRLRRLFHAFKSLIRSVDIGKRCKLQHENRARASSRPQTCEHHPRSRSRGRAELSLHAERKRRSHADSGDHDDL